LSDASAKIPSDTTGDRSGDLPTNIYNVLGYFSPGSKAKEQMKSEYSWPATILKLLTVTVRTRTAVCNPSILRFTCADLKYLHATGSGAPPSLEFELQQQLTMPIPAAARSNACVCSRSLAGTAGSNPARSIVVCLL
jgi:hypothetical protein